MLFKKIRTIVCIIGILVLSMVHASSAQSSAIPVPEKFFGFKPGADRMLFSYETLISYFQALDKASEKVKMTEIGKSPMGKSMYVVFISSEKNIANLEELRTINKELALDPGLSASRLNDFARNGKVFLMATLSMHSTEVGPAQASPLIAWQLVTSDEPAVKKILNEVVFMVVPTHNPDGMDMVVDHYNKFKGTKYEKSSLPGVYHKYLGHDNNRDFNNLTQEDTRAVSRLYSTEWYPQVLTDKHQMGMTGVRYFVPPYHDPISENIDPELWNWTGVFGANLIKDMTKDNLAGVSHNNGFDNYWPGSTKTCLWKNIITFLTECASAHIATPAFVEPTELSVGGKGLSEYKISTNMPMPWPGGWWRLGDIVSYEISSTFSALSTAAANREEILRFRNLMCKRQVELGKTQPPFYYILPWEQHDQGELVSLVRVMQEHGVEVYRMKKPWQEGNRMFSAGDIVIPLAQPYRALIKELMEKQYYPERHYTPGGLLIKPYDITSWSLPMHRGLESHEMIRRLPGMEKELELLPVPFRQQLTPPKSFSTVILPADYNDSYRLAFAALGRKITVERTKADRTKDGKTIPAGSFIMGKSPDVLSLLENADGIPLFLNEKPDVETEILKMPRIALVETWFGDMDAGWTRFLLDSYNIPFTVLHPGDIVSTNLADNFDLLLLPDNNKTVLMEGRYRRDGNVSPANYAPEYTKGFTTEGFSKILYFLQNGGIVVSWGESTNLFSGTLTLKGDQGGNEEFRLPFENISEELTKAGLYAPGTLTGIELLAGHPLTRGLPAQGSIFYRGRGVFSTSVPLMDTDRRVIGKFSEKEILRSGYMEKEELLSNKPAMVWVRKGDGQLVLMAFSPAFRASTQGSYKLLFNAILLGPVEN